MHLIQNIFHQFPISIMTPIPSFFHIIQQFSELTIFCIQSTLDDADDTWLLEAGDTFLEIWALLIEKLYYNYGSAPSAEFLAQLTTAASKIVDAYISMRMLPTADEEVDDDDPTKDCEFHHDQLIHIAALGRLSPQPLLTHLISLIGEKQRFLIGVIAVHETYCINYIIVAPDVYQVQEQLHWLTLISGHILADAPEGETPTIPRFLQVLSNFNEAL